MFNYRFTYGIMQNVFTLEAKTMGSKMFCPYCLYAAHVFPLKTCPTVILKKHSSGDLQLKDGYFWCILLYMFGLFFLQLTCCLFGLKNNFLTRESIDIKKNVSLHLFHWFI